MQTLQGYPEDKVRCEAHKMPDMTLRVQGGWLIIIYWHLYPGKGTATCRRGLGSVNVLIRCALSLAWPGAPHKAWEFGLHKTLLPEPLWEVGCQQDVSCHHADLLDVQADLQHPSHRG